MGKPLSHTLSDGNVITVEVHRQASGSTVYRERINITRPTGTMMRIGTSLFLVTNESLVPIKNSKYSEAADDKEGAKTALRFFVDSAEAVIAHAKASAIPVERLYGER